MDRRHGLPDALAGQMLMRTLMLMHADAETWTTVECGSASGPAELVPLALR
jgi:hypothetical protein